MILRNTISFILNNTDTSVIEFCFVAALFSFQHNNNDTMESIKLKNDILRKQNEDLKEQLKVGWCWLTQLEINLYYLKIVK